MPPALPQSLVDMNTPKLKKQTAEARCFSVNKSDVRHGLAGFFFNQLISLSDLDFSPVKDLNTLSEPEGHRQDSTGGSALGTRHTQGHSGAGECREKGPSLKTETCLRSLDPSV